jgi:2-phosphosulfolactate phosphatase
MDPSERAKVYVHLLPKLIPPSTLRGGVAVVVDVLRATTVMVHALAAECDAVIPCGEIDEARAVAASLPPGTALLAGERHGLPIDGFDLGNSPGEMTPDVCRAKTIVITTTNGTRAVRASLEADRVYIAAFANLRATSAELSVQFYKKDHGRPVHIICAGTEGHVSLEDSLLAGALASGISGHCSDVALTPGLAQLFGNDEALMVVSQWLEVERYLQKRPLWKLLRLGRGGRNVERIGRGIDIVDCASADRFELVAELERGASICDLSRIVAV